MKFQTKILQRPKNYV